MGNALVPAAAQAVPARLKAQELLRPFILSVILRNEPGALARVVGLFSARGYNIEDLSVASINEEVSRMTVVCMAPEDETLLVQIMHQIEKIFPVVRVRNLTHDQHRADVEAVLLRVDFDLRNGGREEALRIAHQFNATTAKEGPGFVTFLYMSTNATAMQQFADQLAVLGNIAIAKSGLVSLGGRQTSPQVP